MRISDAQAHCANVAVPPAVTGGPLDKATFLKLIKIDPLDTQSLRLFQRGLF